MTITKLLVLAILVEAIWEILKLCVPVKLSDKVDSFCVMLLGVLLAFASNADLFVLLGLDLKIPILGIVLTGIIISRGSNYLHDLIKKLNVYKDLLGPGEGKETGNEVTEIDKTEIPDTPVNVNKTSDEVEEVKPEKTIPPDVTNTPSV